MPVSHSSSHAFAAVRAGAICVAVVLAARAASAQPLGDSASRRAPRGGLDFTLFDAPYNTAHEGIRAPSMPQSLDLSIAAYEVGHERIQRLFGERRRLGRAAVALVDVLTTLEVALPLSTVWVHEEFHRTAMGRRGIDSFNDVYKFDIDAAWIAVSHVKDEDLVRIKRDHPAEWVRVNEAGIEGELVLVRELERRRFFGHSRAWHLPLYWLTKLGTIGYVASGDWSDIDADVDESNRNDGADIERRDFTGHDFLGWVYDLHRRDEPYTTRGVHPSGVGIDRYVKRSDLTPEERRYLRRQGRLQLLNLVDPFLYGLNGGVSLGSAKAPLRVNVGMAHFLTSFGHTVDMNVLVRRGDLSAALTLHAYENDVRMFPGMDLELVDLPVAVRGRSLAVSARAGLWMQPDGQRFRTRDGAPGALGAVRVRTALSRRVGAFAELAAKSAGWVAGNPYLNGGTAIRMGISTLRQ